jgi:hypothetical protein
MIVICATKKNSANGETEKERCQVAQLSGGVPSLEFLKTVPTACPIQDSRHLDLFMIDVTAKASLKGLLYLHNLLNQPQRRWR